MSISRMRVAISADTRNFDAAMRHVRGQAAQARRSVAPALGMMSGGMGRMAGMGLGMAAMGGPMAAVAAATAAVAAAVNAIKERRGSEDANLREIIAQGVGPQLHARQTMMAQMIDPTMGAADIQGLEKFFREMGEQQQLDLRSLVGGDTMEILARSTGEDLMKFIRQAMEATGGQFAQQIGGKEGAMMRRISMLQDEDIGRAFSQQPDPRALSDASQRERERVASLGESFGQFIHRLMHGELASDVKARRERDVKELERLGRVPV